MRGPFPDVRFVATGGIDTANAPEFLAAGAAVSLGSAFADADVDAVAALTRPAPWATKP
jgi:2-keto-3-deoxy-6-phosphogluconate aldolase